jgi:predicted transcriptional regulator
LRARARAKAKMNHRQLKIAIADLIQKKLIEERKNGKRRVDYAAIPRAKTIISHYEELKKMLQIEENQHHPF